MESTIDDDVKFTHQIELKYSKCHEKYICNRLAHDKRAV